MINQSTVVITVVLTILNIAVPRRYFLLPFIMTACFVPTDQRIIILSLDFTPLRILIVVSILRLMLLEKKQTIQWNCFDKLVLAWSICGAIVYVIQWMSIRAVIFKCGILFDVIGLYSLFRISIRQWKDINLVIKFFAVCSLITAVLVGFEYMTGQNPFIILGKVRTWVRDGHYRCQASFPHSIMLGLFWATLIPLFVGMAKRNRQQKYLYGAAVIACIWIVLSTMSSTPALTLIAILVFLLLFRYRCYGRQAAWGLVGLTIALHIAMNAPVWHLIARVNVVSGSTGWHRYHLIDETIKNFSEWALLGCRSTDHWGFMLVDVTNQFVLEGVRGGIIALILFIILLVFAVKITGSYSLKKIPVGQQWLAWGICVSVLGHCVSFWGVSYFGQIRMLLYLTFAVVGFIAENNLDSNSNKT